MEALKFQTKDGDGTEHDDSLESINIEVIANGWIVRVADEETEEKHVFEVSSGLDMLVFIQNTLGVLSE